MNYIPLTFQQENERKPSLSCCCPLMHHLTKDGLFSEQGEGELNININPRDGLYSPSTFHWGKEKWGCQTCTKAAQQEEQRRRCFFLIHSLSGYGILATGADPEIGRSNLSEGQRELQL